MDAGEIYDMYIELSCPPLGDPASDFWEFNDSPVHRAILKHLENGKSLKAACELLVFGKEMSEVDYEIKDRAEQIYESIMLNDGDANWGNCMEQATIEIHSKYSDLG